MLEGDDVFISYSRADASDYALALADELTKAGLSCFLDQWGTEPQTTLPPDLMAALRGSSALVVIASPGAAHSAHVGEEVATFRKLHRPILPVSIDDAEAQASWGGEVKGLALSRDTAEELAAGRPGRDVVNRITAALAFRSRRRRLRRGLYFTAALLAGAAFLLLLTANAASRQERRARALAMANQAAELVGSDPAGALRIALMAMDEDDNLPANRVLADVLRRHRRLAVTFRADGRGGVTGLAFSPDGTLLVATGEERRLRFWDVRTMRELPAQRSPETRFTTGALAFTPDGRWLLWGGAGHVSVWRTASRSRVSVLDVPGWVGALAIRGDGLIAVGLGQPWVRLLRLESDGRLRDTGAIALPENEFVSALHFHPTEGTLAIGGRYGVYFADADRAVVASYLPVDSGFDDVERLAYSPDGRSLAVSDVDERVLLWNTQSWVRSELLPPDTVTAYRSGAVALSFRTDGTLLAAGPTGLILASRERSPGGDQREPLDTVGAWPAAHSALAMSADGRTLASGSRDGMVNLWTLEGPQWLRRDVDPGIRALFAIATDASGRRFLAGRETTLGVWDARTAAFTPLHPRARAGVLNAAGTRAIVASRDSLAVYSLDSGAERIDGAATGIADPIELHISGDGHVVVVRGDSAAFVWDTRSRRSLGRVAAVDQVLAISPDGRRLAFAAVNDGLVVADVDGRRRFRLSRDADSSANPLAAVFTRGRRELLSYYDSGVMVRWRLEGLRRGAVEVDTVVDPSAAAAGRMRPAANFSADGGILAAKHGSRPTMVWDVARGGPLVLAEGAPDLLGRMALSRDGSSLVVADAAGTHAMDLSLRSWILAACSLLAVPTDSATPRDRVERTCGDARASTD